MTALRALVLEDEWSARGYLVELLQETGRVTVVAAVAAAEQAMQVIEAGVAVDVAFVDVHIAGSANEDDGMRWVRAVAQRGSAPKVVLTTASDRHAIEAYALGVQDYLLKPFTAERVAQCVQRVAEASQRASAPPQGASTQRVAARSGQTLVFLAADEVWAFEASSRLTFVHTRRGRYDVDLSLSALEALLGSSLLRVHRSWLVRAEHVRGIDRAEGESVLLLGDGDGELRVPVARDRAAAVRDALLAATVGLRKT